MGPVCRRATKIAIAPTPDAIGPDPRGTSQPSQAPRAVPATGPSAAPPFDANVAAAARDRRIDPRRRAGALAALARVTAIVGAVFTAAPGEAFAGEPPLRPVRAKPAGLAWELAPAPALPPCSPAGCVTSVPGGRYDFTAGVVGRERVEVTGPTTLTAHRGAPPWHRASGYMVGGGLGLGAAALAGAFALCRTKEERAPAGEWTRSNPCDEGPPRGGLRDAQLALYATSGAGFATAFAGVFAYFFTGARVGLGAGGPGPAGRPRRVAFGLAPTRGGGTGSITLRF